jgi:phenylacetate-coenzyme A ligase PaaK-like adenylate-forming protein
MSSIAATPLDQWVNRKIGQSGKIPLRRNYLVRYQLEALNRTLAYVRQNSPYYRQQLAEISLPLQSLDELSALPFTTAADLRRDPLALLCVSQDRITRVVTLESSGTTGTPKRLFFTDADLELTVDFFHRGMATLVSPGQRVLILMPGDLPGSVGDLLTKALARMDVRGIVYGPVHDPEAAVQTARRENIDSLVGIPVQVLAMARHAQSAKLAGRIRSVLLSTDFVAEAVVAAIKKAWGSQVYRHYGMTEMGLGGAVECAARYGYHFREADLLVEIVDPQTRRPVPNGTPGEIVFTTLTREGMPLIRYGTGDRAAFKRAPCPCGTDLRTLDVVRGRWHDRLSLVGDAPLWIGHLDETLFGIEDVVCYQAALRPAQDIEHLMLYIAIREGGDFAALEEHIHRAVSSLPAVREACRDGRLKVVVRPAEDRLAASTGIAKRRIQDLRERKPHP